MIEFGVITPDLFVGSHPRSDVDATRLRTAGITAIMSLQSDADLAATGTDWETQRTLYARRDMVSERVAIRDFDPADVRAHLGEAVVTLLDLLSAGHRVYLHCTAGVQRSPTVAVAYLVWCCGWSLHEAAAHVRARRRSEPYVEAIEAVAPARRSAPVRGQAGAVR